MVEGRDMMLSFQFFGAISIVVNDALTSRLKPNTSMFMTFDEEMVIQNESTHSREQAKDRFSKLAH